MNNILDYLEDYAEYNDTIEPENNTTGVFISLAACATLAVGFFVGRFSYVNKLPSILVHLTRDDKITSLYIDGHTIIQIPRAYGDITVEEWYDLNQEKNNND